MIIQMQLRSYLDGKVLSCYVATDYAMADTEPTQDKDSISILDLFAVLIRHRWFIVLSTFVAALLVVAYSIYSLKVPPDAPLNKIPNVYKPFVEVRLQDTQGQSISSLLSNSDIGLLANLAGGSVASPSSADLAQKLLVGKSLLDELADEFNLVERLEITENPKTKTRRFLAEGFETDFSATTGILTISFEHTDKVFATEIINSALLKLEDRFKELTLISVSAKKEFLEQSIASYEKELRTSQSELIDFQSRYGIISIEVQTEYKLAALSRIDEDILAKKSQHRSLQETRRENDPEVRRLQMEIEILEETRNSLVGGFDTGSSGINIPQSQLPELSARYFNLTRDLQIIQTIYSGLRSQYETLKIEERDTSSRFQVIEEAEIPEMKAGPSRGKICMIVTISAFFLSIFFSFVLEYFENVKRDPLESGKLREIKRMLGLKR